MPTFAIQQTFRPLGPRGRSFFETTGLGTPLTTAQIINLIGSTGANGGTITLSETVAQGALINIWNNGGAANARNADGSTQGKEANGFALEAGNNGDQIQFAGAGAVNQFATGLTPGAREFLGTAGATTETVNTTAGGTNQTVGKALSATSYLFSPGEPYEVQAAA